MITEAPVEGSVLSFLKAEWKVSDTGSAQCWASSFYLSVFFAILVSKSNLLLNNFF